MNMTTLPSFDVMMLIARAVLLIAAFVVAAFTFSAWRRATRLQAEQIASHWESLVGRLNALETRLEAVAATATRIDERSERQSHVSSPPADYQVAIRLARGGASREELVSRCGLSLGEADLVRRLHSGSNAAAA